MAGLDPAVAELLSLDPASTTVTSHSGGGGMSSASTSKITTTLLDGSRKAFFLKTGTGAAAEVMFRGMKPREERSHSVVPSPARRDRRLMRLFPLRRARLP